MTASQLRLVVEEVTQVKSTLQEQHHTLPTLIEQRGNERTLAEAGEYHLLFLSPNIRCLPKANTEPNIVSGDSFGKQTNSEVIGRSEGQRTERTVNSRMVSLFDHA